MHDPLQNIKATFIKRRNQLRVDTDSAQALIETLLTKLNYFILSITIKCKTASSLESLSCDLVALISVTPVRLCKGLHQHCMSRCNLLTHVSETSALAQQISQCFSQETQGCTAIQLNVPVKGPGVTLKLMRLRCQFGRRNAVILLIKNRQTQVACRAEKWKTVDLLFYY